MIKKSNSTIDQNINRPEFKKIKPLHFLIVFVFISMLFAFIIGGFYIGKNNSQKEKQEAAVTLEEQVNLNPVDLPGNPDNWLSYELKPLNIRFKLPEELNKKGDWKVNEIAGITGKKLCFSDEKFQNEKECKGNTLVIASTSNNFTSDENPTFLDSQGFLSENGLYFVNTLTGQKVELTNTKFKPYINNENYEILKIVGKADSLTQTPENGYLGAIVNTKNEQYPSIVLTMNINGDISEYEFDQILESFENINE